MHSRLLAALVHCECMLKSLTSFAPGLAASCSPTISATNVASNRIQAQRSEHKIARKGPNNPLKGLAEGQSGLKAQIIGNNSGYPHGYGFQPNHAISLATRCELERSHMWLAAREVSSRRLRAARSEYMCAPSEGLMCASHVPEAIKGPVACAMLAQICTFTRKILR